MDLTNIHPDMIYSPYSTSLENNARPSLAIKLYKLSPFMPLFCPRRPFNVPNITVHIILNDLSKDAEPEFVYSSDLCPFHAIFWRGGGSVVLKRLIVIATAALRLLLVT